VLEANKAFKGGKIKEIEVLDAQEDFSEVKQWKSEQ